MPENTKNQYKRDYHFAIARNFFSLPFREGFERAASRIFRLSHKPGVASGRVPAQ
jgi:hypothetical protein